MGRRQSGWRRCCLPLLTLPFVWLAALAHASLVFICNAPASPLRASVQRVLDFYSGPQLTQGWTMFAQVPDANIVVLARGRLASGRTTPWCDVSGSLDSPPAIGPLRPLSEALSHSSADLVMRSGTNVLVFGDIVDADVVARTSAMVLHACFPGEPMVEEQAQARLTYLSRRNGVRFNQHVYRLVGWRRLPDVDALRF